jgi:hypothetical protein
MDTVVRLLLEKGAKVRELGASIPHITAEHLRLILSKGYDINQVDEMKNTILHTNLSIAYAPENIDAIINSGIDLNKKSRTGRTPLHILFFKGQADERNRMHVLKSLLRAGIDVNPGKDIREYTPLHYAIERGNLAEIKELVNAGADMSETGYGGETALDIARRRGDPDIVEYVEDTLAGPGERVPRPVELWKGWSRAEIKFLDAVLDPAKASNVSLCPVCANYAERIDGCMYMHHDCKRYSGVYNKTLYKKYRNYEGEVEWCTHCGRPCVEHRHLKLLEGDKPLPTGEARFAAPPAEEVQEHFLGTCVGIGGGGLPEKVARLRAFREEAAKLVPEVGKLTKQEAIDRLTLAAHEEPMKPGAIEAAEKILRNAAWNSSNNAFPENTKPNTATANANAPDVRRPAANATDPDLQPIVHPAGTEGAEDLVGLDDEVPVIQLRHRKKNGRVNKHSDRMIGAPSLVDYLKSSLGDYATNPRFGHCWDDECDAIVYPDELQSLVPEHVPADLFEKYKRVFNKKFAAVPAGGGSRSTRSRSKSSSKRKSSSRAKRSATRRRRSSNSSWMNIKDGSLLRHVEGESCALVR